MSYLLFEKSELCCFQQSAVIDQSTASVICQNCARVLQEGLTHYEVNPQRYPIPGGNLKEEKKEEKINGETPIKLLEKISAKLHLHKSSIDKAYDEYYINREKIDKSLNHQSKKPFFLSRENVLIYSIYTSLKQDLCPRSIKEICNIAGVQNTKSILKIGTFLEKSRGADSTPTRLKPITARDIILTHYTYITGLTFDDVKQISHRLIGLGRINFTPLTTAAGAVYLYTNTDMFQMKSKKQTLQQVSSLFKTTAMSIQRFKKKYKMLF